MSAKSKKENAEKKKDVRIINADRGLSPDYLNFVVSPQIFLRPVFPDDWASMVPMFGNEKAMALYGVGKTLNDDEVKKMIATQAKTSQLGPTEHRKKAYSRFDWTAITPDGIAGKVTGVSLWHPETEPRDMYAGINPKFWSKNIATLTGKFLMDVFPSTYEATAHPSNFGSEGVLQKLGFKRDMSRQNVLMKYGIRNYWIKEDPRIREEAEVLRSLQDWAKFSIYSKKHIKN